MNDTQDIKAFRDQLASLPPVVPGGFGDLGKAVFTASGDSLASGYQALPFGHQVMSAGDIAWANKVPMGCDTVIGISHSGSSGAAVKALRLARQAGVRTIALTSNPGSPLAEAADEVQMVPSLSVSEEVPVAGHIILSQGVSAICGVDTVPLNAALAEAIDAIEARVDEVVDQLPDTTPVAGVTVLSLPDLRSAGNFWTLKLMEGCGLTARDVPLEECGHVDYFIGPEPRIAFMLDGGQSKFRYDTLGAALASTGQTVITVPLPATPVLADPEQTRLVQDIAMAMVGTWVVYHAARKWGRPPFRGGAVNMDASHVKLEEHHLTVDGLPRTQ